MLYKNQNFSKLAILTLTFSLFSCSKSININDRFCKEEISRSGAFIGLELVVDDILGEYVHYRILTVPENKYMTSRGSASKEKTKTLIKDMGLDRSSCDDLKKKEVALSELALKLNEKEESDKLAKSKNELEERKIKVALDEKFYREHILEKNIFCIYQSSNVGASIRNYSIQTIAPHSNGITLLRGCLNENQSEFRPEGEETDMIYISTSTWNRKIRMHNGAVLDVDSDAELKPNKDNLKYSVLWGRENCLELNRQSLSELNKIVLPQVGDLICDNPTMEIEKIYKVKSIEKPACKNGGQNLNIKIRLLGLGLNSSSEKSIDLNENSHLSHLYTFNHDYCKSKLQELTKRQEQKNLKKIPNSF